ncbi:MAG: hypothetical protein WA849_06005 [Candidatus Udaeobacter sp.]
MANLTVQGTITDPKGNSLYPASVSVYIGMQFVVNTPNGGAQVYFWSGPVNTNDPTVTGTLIASCPGYANNSKTVPLLIGFDHSTIHNTVNFVLTPLSALTFQPVQPRNMCIYVLGSDGNLWFETGPFGNQVPPPRLQVDGNVAAFQALDGNNVVVLGTDGNLWYEVWPFGNVQEVIKNRKQVDGNVGAFQAVLSGYGNNIFVLGTDGNLWCETWPPVNVKETIKTRKQIDANVGAFQALDVNDAFVLGTDGNLWFEGLPFGSVAQTIKNRRQVDAKVKTFQPIDGYNVFVLGTDNNLWLESWPIPSGGVFSAWGNVNETIKNRKQVDGDVAAFQAIDVNTVFILGSDGNLWLETSPWGDIAQMIETRRHVDAHVGAFNVWTDEHHTIGDWVVLVKDTDHVLWYKESSDAGKTWTRMQIDGSVM